MIHEVWKNCKARLNLARKEQPERAVEEETHYAEAEPKTDGGSKKRDVIKGDMRKKEGYR